MPEKRDEEIKTVIAEQMISDKEEKTDESDVNIRRVIIGVVSMAFGLLSIFVPGLIPFRIPSVLSFICIGAGIGILVFAKRTQKTSVCNTYAETVNSICFEERYSTGIT